MNLDLGTELVKSALTLAVSGATLTFGWYAGSRITARWDQKKKRRELTLATTDAFYRSYGEFFAVWKEWSARRRAGVDETARSQLLTRAATAEGAMEALLLKLAVERRLTGNDVEVLGCFRQACQAVRESIRDNRAVGTSGGPWDSSDVPGYLVFKGLATRLAQIVSREAEFPEDDKARHDFRTITSNRFETEWVKIGQRLLDG
ncbi:hypothetical protein [Actinoplanes sp. NPDC049265]|uniref:hypothetical protein n=1 Tax=Actinoplanes sp. NPDC049265 TaxID=3363902 RepID=UPI00371A541D